VEDKVLQLFEIAAIEHQDREVSSPEIRETLNSTSVLAKEATAEAYARVEALLTSILAQAGDESRNYVPAARIARVINNAVAGLKSRAESGVQLRGWIKDLIALAIR